MLRPLGVIAVALLLASVNLTGCCFDCVESTDTSFLTFAFSPDSVGGTGFRRAELQSVYVVTYGQPGFRGVPDTSRQVRPGTSGAASRSLQLYPSPTPPIGRITMSVYAQPGVPFSYRIVVPAAERVYAIDDVVHVFKEGEGGCNCRTLTEKRFTVDGRTEVQLPEGSNTGRPATVLAR
ncbi:hypothetical protein [Hymenobacter sp.]|uniref:hypothetical protein n=1 Tax=Hymenobacter sp. TaxID=1898978 RepID=UPI00286B362B|nr:hypothetical protein [Hymenobacter sp.]